MMLIFGRRKPLVASVLLLAACGYSFAGKEFLAGPREQIVPNQLLVGLQPGADINQIVGALAPQAVATLISSQQNTYLLKLPPGTQAVVSQLLAANPMVNYVEPNRIRATAVAPPNDSMLSQQWNLTTVQALQAWNYFPDQYLTAAIAGSTRVKVAILDSGADCTHPDFMNAGGTSTDSAHGGQLLWASSSAIQATTISSPVCPWEDDFGHGTHVAGIVAAATNNATGVASLGFPLQLIIIKTSDENGNATDSQIAQGITAAINAGAQVICMSLGSAGYSQTLQTAIDTAWQHNILTIAAAGDTGNASLFYPGAGNHVLGVGATDDTNTVASFSTYGEWVKIAAPGVNILSTLPTYGSSLGVNYGSLEGTSMAAPHVAALGGLLFAAYPGISAASVAQRIQQTAQSPNTVWSEYIGYGVIDAGAALGNIPGPFTQGSLTGQVVDSNNNPITGAVVTAGTQSYTTALDPITGSENGLFRINLSPGAYPITVTATGHSTVTTQGVVVAGADTMLTIQMDVSSGEFTGTVTYNGVGVAGAVVEAVSKSSSLILGTAVTGSSGGYTLYAQPGSYTLTASAPNYINTTSSSQSLSANGTVTVNLALSALGNISGTVTDVNGVPVANAHIDFAGASFSGGAVTGSGGSFSTFGIPAGVYTVTASASGYGSVSISGVTVTTNISTTVNLRFSTGVALATGLLGDWPFSEGSGNVAYDHSGNGYNAALSNITWTTGLLFPYALTFNVSRSYGLTPAIPFTGAFSASVWVNSANSQNASSGLVQTESTPGWFLGVDQTGTMYKFIVNGAAGSTGTCGFEWGCAQGGTIASGWHLVTATYDGASAILYVDGVMVASDTFTSTSVTSVLQIGLNWSGAMQSLLLYSRALTASEVSTLFIQGSTANLSLLKMVDSSAVTEGSSIGYTLAASNTGPSTAASATLSDVLPTGTGIGWTISPAYIGPGTCSIASGVLNCSFGNLSPGGRASVHITSATTAASCGWYSNTASMSANNASSVQASATTMVQCSQTIDFGTLPERVYGARPFAINATASSGLPVSFSSLTPSVCTVSVSGATVTLLSGGTCTIQATQEGNSIYSAAQPVNQSFTVTPAGQTITFGPLQSQVFGTATLNISATASSGLAVSFNSLTTSVCTVSGGTVTLVSVGTCTIQATQAGNADWAAATAINQSFSVTQGSQTITFGSLQSQAFGTAPFTVSAAASSGLAVSFNSLTTSVCTVSNATVTLVAVGTCTIQAAQPGNTNWTAAPSVNQSFSVTQGSQTITFGPLQSQAFGTAPFTVSATASSGLAVSFNSQTTSVCTVSNAAVTLVAAGTCTIQAAQAGNTNWSAAPSVNQSFSVTQGSQTIAFGPLQSQAFGTAPFTVSATASSGLPVSFNSQTASVCAVSGSTVTLASVGTCTIQATQAGNTNWAAATSVNQSFSVTQGSQTIVFGSLQSQAFGTPFTLSATASSGLPVSFNSQTTSVCTVSGSTVTLASVGTCTIQATQAGNTNWAAATSVNQSFSVTQGSQTIAFGSLQSQAFGTPSFAVSATASSGLPVSFNSQTGAVCAVSGATVLLVAVGTCTIQATQAGNTNWAAATSVNQSFAVTPGSQTITFGSLPSEVYGSGTFAVSAGASSGLAVSFNSQTGTVCTVSGSTVTLAAVGTCTIQATQPGNTNWAAATPVNQSFAVMQASQTITFGSLPSQAYGSPSFTVSATASSGLPVSFNSQSTPVCTVSGGTVTLVSVGTCTIQATQPGNTNWAAATSVNQSFAVTQASQAITFGSLPSQAYGSPSFAVSATASSGLPVSFNSQSTPVCTVSGGTVTLVSVGTCTIQAAQPGNTNWAAATSVNQSFAVTQASQAITFGSLPSQAYGSPSFTVSAAASSGLPVSFNSQSTPVCTVSGGTVTLVSVGTCTIQATQAGNANYSQASAVNQSFNVTQATQTIAFGALSNQSLGTGPFTVSATASSGLTVSFSSLTASVCTVSAATVTLAAAGTCTIQATQAGNAGYSAAAPVNQSFTVTTGIAIAGVTNLKFPNTIVGKSSAVQTFTLQNSGNTFLTIASIAPAGPDAANYQYTADAVHPCPISPATLGAGAACTLDVAFVPVSPGSHNNAQIAIVDNSGNGVGTTQSIGLAGTGIVLSSIAVNAGSSSLVYGNTEQFTATGTYSDGSTATLTSQVTWSSSATGVAAIATSGLATAVAAGQTNITAALSGVTSNNFQLTVFNGTPASIAAASGSGQSASVSTAFAGALEALVKDGGGDPVPNASVTFTAPSSGAGATFANGLTTCSATTNSSGIATSLALTANATVGSFSVTAGVTGVATGASFSLTNVKASSLTVTEQPVGTFIQGQSESYDVIVGNAANAGPTSGPVTVTITLPAGFTLTGLNGGPTWNCNVATASCTTNAVLNPGSAYPQIVVTVSVGNNAPGSASLGVTVVNGSNQITFSGSLTIVSACNVTLGGSATVADVQREINEALGLMAPLNDLNGDGKVNVLDVQIVLNAAMGMGCSAS
jgi:uncharacterized repeat protein (TIGR01451 family)